MFILSNFADDTAAFVSGMDLLREERHETFRRKHPDVLKALPCWVLWKLEERDGYPTKVPYSTDGVRAKANDPSTWASFEVIIQSLENGDDFVGIGFVLSKKNEFTLIDFDNCRDQTTGRIDASVREWVKKFATYTEVSQSGKRLHVIPKGNISGSRRLNEFVEMHDHMRFVIVTGNRLSETPLSIELR